MTTELPPGFIIKRDQTPAPVPSRSTRPAAPVGTPSPRPVPRVPMAGGDDTPIGTTELPPGFKIKKDEADSGRKVVLAAQNFQNGIANLLGLPVDIVAGGMKLAGIIDMETDPVGSSNNLKAIFQAAQRDPTTFKKITQLEPETSGERVVARTAEEAGAGFAALFPILSIARLGKTVETGSRAIPKSTAGRIGKALIKPFRETPAKASAVELGLATTGGVGAGVAREVVPEGPLAPTAEIAGVLAGSLAPSAAISASRAGVRGFRATTEPFTEAGLARRTGESLVESATDPESLRALDPDLAPQTGEFRPSTAQITQDPGIASLEKEIARESPRLAGSISRQQIANDEILRAELDTLAPQVDEPAEAIAAGVQTRVEAISSALERRVAVAETNIKREVEALAEGPTKEASNKIARAEIDKALEDANVLEAKRWNDVDPNDIANVETAPLVTATNDFIAGIKKADLDDLPESILKTIGAGERSGPSTLDGTENVKEIFAVSSRISTAIREARAVGNFNKARILNKLGKVVDDYLNNLPIEDAGVLDRYQIAKDFTIQKNDVFTRSTVGDVLARTRTGASKTPESATIEKFFRTGRGSQEAIDDFVKAVGDRPKAVQALEDFAVRDLHDAAVKVDGTLDANLAKKWLNKHRVTFRQFPELAGKFDNIFNMQKRLDDVLSRQKRTLDAVNKGAARFFLDQDPDKAVIAALNSKNPADSFRELRNIVKNDKTALAGLRRTILDVLKDKAEFKMRLPDGNTVIKPEAIFNFVKKNRRAMQAVGYKDADIDRIMDITNKANINAGGSALIPGARRAIPEKGFLSINQILSRLYGIQRGVVSKRFVAGELGTRLVSRWVNKLNRRDLQSLMERALADPAFARKISEPILREKSAKEVISIMRGHLTANIIPEDEEK